jgi:hypothetical protein
MRFSLYGRRDIEILREDTGWVAYRPGIGSRARLDDLVIPPELSESDLVTHLDDLFHEMGEPGRSVRRID